MSVLVVVSGICIEVSVYRLLPDSLTSECPMSFLSCSGRLMVSLYFPGYWANFVRASRFVYLFGPPISALGVTLETSWPACRLFCIFHHFVCKNKVMTNKWGSKNPKSKKLSKEHHYIYKNTQMSELYIWSARKNVIVTLSYKVSIFETCKPMICHSGTAGSDFIGDCQILGVFLGSCS